MDTTTAAAKTLTAETITDEQVEDLLAYAQYAEWRLTVAACYVALHGVHLNGNRPRQRPRYSKAHPGYLAARARCAETFNAYEAKINNAFAIEAVSL